MTRVAAYLGKLGIYPRGFQCPCGQDMCKGQIVVCHWYQGNVPTKRTGEKGIGRTTVLCSAPGKGKTK